MFVYRENLLMLKKKIQDFNAGLKELKQTGELNKLLRENHFNEKGIWKL